MTKSNALKMVHSRKPTQLYYTDQLDIFKLFTYNREVNQARTKKLAKVIEELGFITPLIVTQKLFVIDGQHRLAAAKLIRSKVSYIILDVKDEDIAPLLATMNAHSRNWRTEDHFNMWVDLERPDYLYVRDLLHEKNIPFTIFYQAARLTKADRKHEMARGAFVLDKEGREILETRLNQFNEILEFLPRFKMFKQTAFAGAVISMVRNPLYNHERLKTQLRKHGGEIAAAVNIKRFLMQLEDVYNKGKTKKNKVEFNTAH